MPGRALLGGSRDSATGWGCVRNSSVIGSRWEKEGRSDSLLLPFWLIDRVLPMIDGDLLLAQQRDYLKASFSMRDGYWRREARAIAEHAQAEIRRGDPVTGALLALEALPDPERTRDRPILPEVLTQLYEGWVSTGVEY